LRVKYLFTGFKSFIIGFLDDFYWIDDEVGLSEPKKPKNPKKVET